MGLAANQARFLTLSSRMHDLENRVMCLSSQKMIYSMQSMDAAQKYNTDMQNAEAIQGVQVVTGKTPIQKTRTNSTDVTVTGKYLRENGYVITSASNDNNNINSGNTGSVTPFDINSFDYDSHIHLVPGQTFDSPSMYNQKATEFINTYGSGNFSQISQADAVKLVKSLAYAQSLGLTEQQFYQVQNIYNSALMYNPLNEHGDPGTLMNRVGADASQTPGLDPGKACKLSELWWKADKGWNLNISLNEKKIDSDTWYSALESAATASGLDRELFTKAVLNGGSITADEIQKLKGKYTVDYIEGQTYTGYVSAKGNALSKYQLSPEYLASLENSGSQGGDSGNNGGGTGTTYTTAMIDNMTADQIAGLIQAGELVLVSGPTAELPRTYSEESTEYYVEYENIYGTDYSARDTAIAAAKADYDKATAEISKKEKMLDLQMTQSNTELSACNKEYDSVKSLIENNTEKGFKLFS